MASAIKAAAGPRTGATTSSLEHVGSYSLDPATLPGNIENFFGVAQVPIGLAGPLLVNGEHAQGEFFVPLATTEGTLVASYSRGMKLSGSRRRHDDRRGRPDATSAGLQLRQTRARRATSPRGSMSTSPRSRRRPRRRPPPGSCSRSRSSRRRSSSTPGSTTAPAMRPART